MRKKIRNTGTRVRNVEFNNRTHVDLYTYFRKIAFLIKFYVERIILQNWENLTQFHIFISNLHTTPHKKYVRIHSEELRDGRLFPLQFAHVSLSEWFVLARTFLFSSCAAYDSPSFEIIQNLLDAKTSSPSCNTWGNQGRKALKLCSDAFYGTLSIHFSALIRDAALSTCSWF